MSHPTWPAILLALFTALCANEFVRAQDSAGPKSPGAALDQRLRVRVPNENCLPIFWPDDRGFFLRVEGHGDSHFETVTIDPPRRVPAFDAEKLLAAWPDERPRPQRLPPVLGLRRSEDQRTLIWIEPDQHFAWDDARQVAEALAGAPPEFETHAIARRQSRDGGEPTTFVIRNESDLLVDVEWVPARGEARSQGSIGPKSRRVIQSYAGHVFALSHKDEGFLAAYEAQAMGSIARFAQKLPARRRDRAAAEGLRVVTRGHNLLQISQELGEVPLTTDGTADDPYSGPIAHSPDGRFALALRVAAAVERQIPLIETAPKDQLQPKLRQINYRKPGDPLPRPRPVLIHLKDRSVSLIESEALADPWSLSDLRFHRDGKRATFLFNPRGHRSFTLFAIDLETKALSPLIAERPRTFIDYPNKTWMHWIDEDRTILWMSERYGRNALYAHDAETGTELRRLHPDHWIIRRVVAMEPESRSLIAAVLATDPAEDPYHLHFARLFWDGAPAIRLTAGDGTHELQWSPNRSVFIDTYSRVDAPPMHVLRRAADGRELLTLPGADLSALRAAGFRPPLRFKAPGRDGKTPIYGIIHRPSHFEPNLAYPVIESIYAGPHGHHVPKAFQRFYGAQHFAERGFVVVQIDGMGTNWRDKAFHDVAWKNLADAGLKDRIAWIKAAAHRWPWIDAQRVGITGGSAGGQNALSALLFESDFYRAAVADCGCHDNRMDKIWWNELWMSWPLGPHYEEQSNAVQAHRLKGALMLTVGLLDSNVDPASTLQVAEALLKADKDFELIAVPSGGHGVLWHPSVKRRGEEFFLHHLGSPKPLANRMMMLPRDEATENSAKR